MDKSVADQIQALALQLCQFHHDEADRDCRGATFNEDCSGCAENFRVLQEAVRLALPEPEICICAALQMEDGYIFRGHRHDDCYLTMGGWAKYTKADGHAAKQGFLTSRGRFVGRKEAAYMHNMTGKVCASEDLW